jgi:hypothetical protein
MLIECDFEAIKELKIQEFYKIGKIKEFYKIGKIKEFY